MIVHFLVDTSKSMSVTEDVDKFARARPPNIYKLDYIDDLYNFEQDKKPQSLLFAAKLQSGRNFLNRRIMELLIRKHLSLYFKKYLLTPEAFPRNKLMDMLFESSTSEGAQLGKRPASTALENGGKKRASGQMEQTHDIITVVDSLSRVKEVHFKVKRNTKMQKIFKMFCDKAQAEFRSMRFLIDGCRVLPTATPEEMDKAEQPVFLDHASRTTRGKRQLTKLTDDEIEEDEQFWNQDALKEEAEDTNYQEEGEAADVFDSDFDEDEPDQEEAVENEPDDRVQSRKRLVYPGHPASKKKQKKKVISALQRDPNDEQVHGRSTDYKPDELTEDLEVERSIRKSTRTSVIVRQAERDAIRAAVQATMKPIKRKKEGEEKRMTQEEMLLEAAQTEIMNLRNLERVLAREEEVKKRAVVHKAVYSGCSYLEFRNRASFHSKVPATPVVYSHKSVCAVTGLPAKYRDPKTGVPYATKEAFKVIHERASHENKNLGQKNGEGDLCDLLSNQGFSRQRKRSVIPNSKDTSSFRLVARFRRFSDSR
ncbi:hypothetical protein ACET3Z_031858 [Daucus carota]